MLSARDHAAAADFLLALHACRDPETFRHCVVRGLGRLIGADQTTWNELAVTVPRAVVTEDPPLTSIDRDWAEATFAAHMAEHPCLERWLRTGDNRPVAISDLVSRRAYHRTDLYQAFYRLIGYEDQLAVNLTPPGGQTLGLGLARDRPGFDARERAQVELLVPHIHQAWCNVQALARAERALAGHEQVAEALGQAIVALDRHGRPQGPPSRAIEWLQRYFAGTAATHAGCLPDTVAGWVRQCRQYNDGRPLVRRRGERELRLRYFPRSEGAAMLLLEERTLCGDTRHLRAAGLTRREIEVLVAIEGGRSNADVAAVLCVSPATVKKHLGRIYFKLGVRNRTEAVALLRGRTRESASP